MTGANLGKLQDLFQDRLLTGADGIVAHLTAGGPFLKVYDHAYAARLVEVLEEDYPALHTLLGDEQFAEAAGGYVAAHRSTHRSVRWFGAGLAGWLKETAPWSDLPVLADMAGFEWALGLAFDAPDAAALGMEALAAVPPDIWPMLTFEFHPSLNTCVLGHDVAPFQQAVAKEAEPDAAPGELAEPVTVAAWRDDGETIVRFRDLAVDEAACLARLRASGDFQAMCEAAAEAGHADGAAMRAAGLLAHWVQAGWIVGLDAPGISWA